MTQLRIAAFLGEGEQHLRRHLLPPRHGRSYLVSHRQDVFAYRGCHSRLQRRARRPDRQAHALRRASFDTGQALPAAPPTSGPVSTAVSPITDTVANLLGPCPTAGFAVELYVA